MSEVATSPQHFEEKNNHSFEGLTIDWGSTESVRLYLDRCQVSTPHHVVDMLWTKVRKMRPEIGLVVDFGAGDGRFSKFGTYNKYVGYEIEINSNAIENLPKNAILKHQCAFSTIPHKADLCVGNPPYVRNQDLPLGWRDIASNVLAQRSGLKISGLANAWQYFLLLSLISTDSNGLVALIIPYEWVSRPSVKVIRDFIKANNWEVSVYRLKDETFSRVLTSSSMTIIDKKKSSGKWRYYGETHEGKFIRLKSESGNKAGVITHSSRAQDESTPYAKRGLSPGTQKVLVLTEGERARLGLRIKQDVVPCVTSLRHVDLRTKRLNERTFNQLYRYSGSKCWLIRTDKTPSRSLRAYLDNVSESSYQTATCLKREEWWKFTMPVIPNFVLSTGFTKTRPKFLINDHQVRAVGGVCGIYNVPKKRTRLIAHHLSELDLSGKIVPHSHGLKKLEINQINTILNDAMKIET